MGIFDGKSQQQIADEYKRQLQMQERLAHGVRINQTGNIAIGTTGPSVGVGTLPPTKPITVEELNNDPVYGPSLSMLVDLWKAAWGEGWTSLDSVGADDSMYWNRVIDRLERALLVERFPGTYTYRIRS